MAFSGTWVTVLSQKGQSYVLLWSFTSFFDDYYLLFLLFLSHFLHLWWWSRAHELRFFELILIIPICLMVSIISLVFLCQFRLFCCSLVMFRWLGCQTELIQINKRHHFSMRLHEYSCLWVFLLMKTWFVDVWRWLFIFSNDIYVQN